MLRFRLSAIRNHPTSVDRRKLLPWLSTAVLIAAAIGFWAVLQRPRTPLARLAASAPSEVRLLEPRLTGFPWAPLTNGQRAGGMAGLRTAATEIQQAAAADPSDELAHAAAVAFLLKNRPDDAVVRLRPTAEKGRDPSAWSDLGAAYYAAAARSASTEHLGQALAATDQALLIDPAHGEALFNRALILERFHFRDAAASAWREFVAGSREDGWREEGRRHLAAVTAPLRTVDSELRSLTPRLERGDGAAARTLLQMDAGDARQFGETEGLARWGEAWLRGDMAAAERHLKATRTLASELFAFNGEALLLDASTRIEQADPGQARALARGHVGFRDGRRAYDARTFLEAEKMLSSSARELERGSSPLSREARLFEAGAIFWQGRHEEGEVRFRELLPLVPERHAALRAMVQWQLASCFMARSETGNSLDNLSRATSVFTRLGEKNTAAYLHNIISQVYVGAGDHQRAARHRGLALGELGKTSNQRLVHAVTGMVYDALQRKEWRIARSLLNVQIMLHAKAKNAEDLHSAAFLRRARVHAQLGEGAAAQADLRAAAAIVASVPDPAHRAKMQIDYAAAEALVSENPRTAIPLLTQVLRFHEEKGWRRLMPELYLRRGRMYRASGDRRQAVSDFEAGIAILEQHRQSVSRGEQRWGILDAGEELFDEAIAEALHSGAEAAFRYAERKRARSLADTVSEGAGEIMPARIPADTVIVEYAALPDRLAIFVADRTGFRVRIVPIPRARLALLAGQFTESFRDPSTARRTQLAAELGRALITPVWPLLAGRGEVVFITDAATSGIAFAALPDGAGRMLVEDVTISVAPSVRLYLAARARSPQPRANILIVDSPVNPALKRLAATSAEADALEKEYPHALRLSGRTATRDAFMREARTADVIHFAGHGVTGLESAALILTSTASDSGVFEAASISRLALRHTDIVVLAACDTARGPVRAAEGVLSVTHAFLQAGAPAVIATLWPLNDRAAADFFPRLHRHLARGVPAAQALRAAQLELIHGSSSDRASLWAAVQVVGY
jgi:CHAT domain-containing protein